MATRFYFPSASTVASPLPALAIDATGWTTTSSNFFRAKLVPITPDATTSLTNIATTYAGASGDFVCVAQFVSPPLSAGATWTSESITTSLQGLESNNLANAFLRRVIRILSGDGTTERFRNASTDGSELTTSLGSRDINASTGLTATVSAGDRFVYEVGFRKDSTNSYTINVRLGDNGSVDVTQGEADTGTVDNSWFEIAPTVTFDAEAATGTPNQLMLTGCGI